MDDVAVPADVDEYLFVGPFREVLSRRGNLHLFTEHQREIACRCQLWPIENDLLLLSVLVLIRQIGNVAREDLLMQAIVDTPHEGMLLEPVGLIGVFGGPFGAVLDK